VHRGSLSNKTKGPTLQAGLQQVPKWDPGRGSDWMSTDKQIHLLDGLQSLLEKQIELARRSNFRKVEALAEQAGSIIGEIVRTKVLEQAEFRQQGKHLAKLYRQLTLMLAAEKEHLSGQLQRVSKGKKILEAYRNNV